MFQRMLLTLDGSEFAEAALPAAVGLAAKTGAELRLLTVHDSGWALVNGEWIDPASSRAARYLEKIRTLVEPIWPDVSATVTDGFVVDEILRVADEFGADLSVMATHGRGPISRFWLGGVANQCLRRACRPMLLVRPREPGTPREPGSLAVRRIVVPLDGSALAETALGPALELADRFAIPVTAARVVPSNVVVAYELLPEHERVNHEILDAACEDASSYLGGVAEWMRGEGSAPPLR